MADRGAQHGRGVRRRGAARRAGEHGRLGLQQGGGLGVAGGVRHRRHGGVTAAATGAAGCVPRMLSNARVQGRHSVEPGSEGAPQLSHGPTVRATVGAWDGSMASAAPSATGASVSLPPQNGQNLAPSTTVVWQWSQYTRISPSPGFGRSHFSPATRGRKLPATWPGRGGGWRGPRDEAAGARRPVRRRASGAAPGDAGQPGQRDVFRHRWPRNDARPSGVSVERRRPARSDGRPRMTAAATRHERERDGVGSAGDARDRTRPAGGTLRRRRARWSASRAVDIGPHRR